MKKALLTKQHSIYQCCEHNSPSTKDDCLHNSDDVILTSLTQFLSPCNSSLCSYQEKQSKILLTYGELCVSSLLLLADYIRDNASLLRALKAQRTTQQEREYEEGEDNDDMEREGETVSTHQPSLWYVDNERELLYSIDHFLNNVLLIDDIRLNAKELTKSILIFLAKREMEATERTCPTSIQWISPLLEDEEGNDNTDNGGGVSRLGSSSQDYVDGYYDWSEAMTSTGEYRMDLGSSSKDEGKCDCDEDCVIYKEYYRLSIGYYTTHYNYPMNNTVNDRDRDRMSQICNEYMRYCKITTLPVYFDIHKPVSYCLASTMTLCTIVSQCMGTTCIVSIRSLSLCMLRLSRIQYIVIHALGLSDSHDDSNNESMWLYDTSIHRYLMILLESDLLHPNSDTLLNDFLIKQGKCGIDYVYDRMISLAQTHPSLAVFYCMSILRLQSLLLSHHSDTIILSIIWNMIETVINQLSLSPSLTIVLEELLDSSKSVLIKKQNIVSNVALLCNTIDEWYERLWLCYNVINSMIDMLCVKDSNTTTLNDMERECLYEVTLALVRGKRSYSLTLSPSLLIEQGLRAFMIGYRMLLIPITMKIEGERVKGESVIEGGIEGERDSEILQGRVIYSHIKQCFTQRLCKESDIDSDESVNHIDIAYVHIFQALTIFTYYHTSSTSVCEGVTEVSNILNIIDNTLSLSLSTSLTTSNVLYRELLSRINDLLTIIMTLFLHYIHSLTLSYSLSLCHDHSNDNTMRESQSYSERVNQYNDGERDIVMIRRDLDILIQSSCISTICKILRTLSVSITHSHTTSSSGTERDEAYILYICEFIREMIDKNIFSSHYTITTRTTRLTMPLLTSMIDQSNRSIYDTYCMYANEAWKCGMAMLVWISSSSSNSLSLAEMQRLIAIQFSDCARYYALKCNQQGNKISLPERVVENVVIVKTCQHYMTVLKKAREEEIARDLVDIVSTVMAVRRRTDIHAALWKEMLIVLREYYLYASSSVSGSKGGLQQVDLSLPGQSQTILEELKALREFAEENPICMIVDSGNCNQNKAGSLNKDEDITNNLKNRSIALLSLLRCLYPLLTDLKNN